MRLYRIALTVALMLASLFTVLPVRAAPLADDVFLRTWARTDLPVAAGRVSRTWM